MNDEMELDFAALLAETDDAAVTAKWRRTALWAVQQGTNTLLLAVGMVGIAGMFVVWFGSAVDAWILEYGISILHYVAIGVIGAQLLFGPRGVWLKRRAIAERLQKHAMWYRAGVEPYDKPDADKKFQTMISAMRERLEKRKPLFDFLKLRSLRLSAAFKLEPKGDHGFPGDAPSKSLTPRACNLEPRDALNLALHRLEDQRFWHTRKAGYFYRRYLFWQGVNLVALIVATVINRFAGHAYETVLVTGSIGLFLNALLNFCEYNPVSLRYEQLAKALVHVRRDFEPRLEESLASGDRETFNEELAKFVEAIEDKMQSGFDAWYLVQEAFPD